jgi:hypothetical protein
MEFYFCIAIKEKATANPTIAQFEVSQEQRIDSVAQLVEQPDRRTDTFKVWILHQEKPEK